MRHVVTMKQRKALSTEWLTKIRYHFLPSITRRFEMLFEPSLLSCQVLFSGSTSDCFAARYNYEIFLDFHHCCLFRTSAIRRVCLHSSASVVFFVSTGLEFQIGEPIYSAEESEPNLAQLGFTELFVFSLPWTI